MTDVGAIPTVVLDEDTLPSGLNIQQPDYYDVALRRLSLVEQLEKWHTEAWGGEA